MSEKKIFVVDSQRLNQMQFCMRSYLYKFGKSFEPAVTPIQFERGSLMHDGLEFYYKAKQIRSVWAENNLTHADVVQQAVQYMREKAIEMNAEIEDLEDVISVFLQYTKHYETDGWDDILGIEDVGTKILYEDEEKIFVYEFKIDLMISLSNMPRVPVDHKSYSRKSYTSDMSNQFKGYAWAMGVNNIIVNKIGFQKTVLPKDKFTREVLSYTPERLEEWVNNAIFWINQAIHYIEADIYPMNETSCDKYSGCTFRQICQANPDDRENKLNQLYKVREAGWDPGKGLEV